MSERRKDDAVVSRRQFLKFGASSLGGLAVLCAEAAPAQASDAGSAEIPAILIDAGRCIGCGNCQRSCSQANQLHPTREQQGKLSDQTYVYIAQANTDKGERNVYRSCMHCQHPACVSACTVGALTRSSAGLVTVDTGKCIGCRYCQYACPFGVPQYEWDQPLGTIRKCTSCLARLALGQQPACTTNCPTGAIKFGLRPALLQEAHMRLIAHPEHYVDHVYGEKEIGGTARLYISDVPFSQLGLPALGEEAAPDKAVAAMTQTPTVALSVAAVATGIYTLLKLRDRAHPVIVEPEEAAK